VVTELCAVIVGIFVVAMIAFILTGHDTITIDFLQPNGLPSNGFLN
jgi:hypothetical protein